MNQPARTEARPLRLRHLTALTLVAFFATDAAFKVLVLSAFLDLVGDNEPERRWPALAHMTALVVPLIVAWLLAVFLSQTPLRRWSQLERAGAESLESLQAATQCAQALPRRLAVLWSVEWLGAIGFLLFERGEAPSPLAAAFFLMAMALGPVPLAHGLGLWLVTPTLRHLAGLARVLGVTVHGPRRTLRRDLVIYSLCLCTAPTAYMASLALSARAQMLSPSHLLMSIAIYFCGVILFAVLCAALLASKITGPVAMMSEVVRSISQEGDVSRVGRVPPEQRDELGELAEHTNAMIDRLETTAIERTTFSQSLADLNHTLEERVKWRTLELEALLTELDATQRKLVDAARRAGMADVATTVLHNVGNVLNSVNVSAYLVADLVRGSKQAGLHKAMDLLQAQPEPGRFLGEDPRGETWIAYMSALAKSLQAERDEMMRELNSLTKNIDHIKVVVGMQQAIAKNGGVIERLQLAGLIEDALTFNASPQQDRDVRLVRELAELEPIVVDRHKLLQILVNLLSNARQAVHDRADDRRIVIRARHEEADQIAIEVEDNGVGIPAENLRRVFNHGFTTKPQGHGFGLHGSACAAIELGGSLSVHSDGPGCGARFTLILPRHAKSAGAAGQTAA